jgi:hypothetical protein
MAIKIVQTSTKLSPSPSSAVRSSAITLKSGYVRVSTGMTGAHVAIGTEPTASSTDFHLPPYTAEVIKERIARQKIAGITTGTTTVIHFDNNAGNPFLISDYVSVEGISSPVGINTTHNSIVSMTDSSVTINFNSSALTNIVIGDGSLARSVKVSALGSGGSADVFISEVVQLVTE